MYSEIYVVYDIFFGVYECASQMSGAILFHVDVLWFKKYELTYHCQSMSFLYIVYAHLNIHTTRF